MTAIWTCSARRLSRLGGGLGKEHALELARRGAKVVVNDLGGSVDGDGASDAANAVVDQIISVSAEVHGSIQIRYFLPGCSTIWMCATQAYPI